MRYVQCYNKNCNKISLRLSFSGGSFLNTLIPFLAFAMKLVCVEITGSALLLSFHWHRKFFSTFITPWVINVFCENCKLMQTVEVGKEDEKPPSRNNRILSKFSLYITRVEVHSFKYEWSNENSSTGHNKFCSSVLKFEKMQYYLHCIVVCDKFLLASTDCNLTG